MHSARQSRPYVSCWLGLGRQFALQATKLIASHFGGTRNPLAIRWPAKIKPDATPHAQFLHVNDVVPTIYDISASRRRAWLTAFRKII